MPAPAELHPRDIRIPPGRQRSELGALDELQSSIAAVGLINAIVVRTADDGVPELVAGGRRLQCCLNLDRPLAVGRDVRFWDDLTPVEAQVVELEENLKREDLGWRDQVRSIGNLHQLYCATHGAEWNAEQTGEKLSLSTAHTYLCLRIFRFLDSPKLAGATGILHAKGILQRVGERRAEEIVSSIITDGTALFAAPATALTLIEGDPTNGTPSHPSGVNLADLSGRSASTASTGGQSGTGASPAASAAPPPPPIICADFTEWAPGYTGPRFNLIHCDFPYGVYMRANLGRDAGTRFGSSFDSTDRAGADIYDNDPELYFHLLETLTGNLDRLVSYSAHLVFWLSMKFYSETVRRLRAADLFVHDHPFIWLKTDGRGIAPAQNIYPKRIYDTALICSRGGRVLVKQGSNAYPAPTPQSPIHPSEKSTPMLKFFFSMLVDETTTVFDPTCGSGAALRAAEELGAKSILGLEREPEYAAVALAATLRARALRYATR